MASSMITGAALITATGAFAQGVPAQTANGDTSTQASEIVVTGTRLRSPNLTSASPVSAVGQQDFKAVGAVDSIDLLNELPQVGLGGTSLNNTPNPLSPSGGFTTIDLRNLGTVRTLVLEDGKRLMPGDPTLGGEAADLDTIPAALIERVDLVTGGASAVYGSDAVAGVVNFIMKHNFQGVEADIQYGFNQHDNNNQNMQNLEKAFGANAPGGSLLDGRTITSTITFGSNTPDDKGNVTGYVSYKHSDPVLQASRDYSACQLSQSSGGPGACVGSSNSNFFSDQIDHGAYSVSGVSPNNVFVSGAARNQSLTPPRSFNSNAYEYLSRGDERYLGGYFAHYDVNPHLDLYSDFGFMDDRTRVDAAPSALFQQIFSVNCNNPLLSNQQRGLLGSNGLAADGVTPLTCAANPTGSASLSIGRRDVEGGPRIYSYEHESFKIDVGARGDFADTWHYDVYAQFGRTAYNYSVQNDISLSKAQNALLVNPATGQCTTIAANASCVPYNIFSNGGVSPAALAYLRTSGYTTGDTQEQIVSANVSGTLEKWGLKSPWAASGVSVSFGTEFRREALDQSPDETSLSGDLAGAGTALPPVHGSFDVKEIFGEIGVPVLTDKPFIKDLSLEGGYRYSDYSLSGGVSAYKIGVNYQPFNDIRLRGSYNRAVRAPNVNELFTPNQIGNEANGITGDPCSGRDLNGNVRQAPATLAACERTGVTPAQYGNGSSTNFVAQCPAFQCGGLTGGSLTLKPETSDTYSGGVVVTPRFIPGLNLSVDYFNINIANAISTVPYTITFNQCLNSGANCNLIVRQSNGSLFGSDINLGGYISGTNYNIGHYQTEGVDFALNYRFDLDKIGLRDKGSFSLRFDGTWTSHYIVEPIPGQGTYNCAGLYGNTCGQPLPNWRHVARLTYQSPLNFSVSAQWRFMGGTKLDNNVASNPLLYAGSFDQNDARIGDYSYLDLSGNWKVKPGLMLRAGVNNVLDTNPPLLDSGVTGSGTPNTWNSYDLLGRQIFVGLTADF